MIMSAGQRDVAFTRNHVAPKSTQYCVQVASSCVEKGVKTAPRNARRQKPHASRRQSSELVLIWRAVLNVEMGSDITHTECFCFVPCPQLHWVGGGSEVAGSNIKPSITPQIRRFTSHKHLQPSLSLSLSLFHRWGPRRRRRGITAC